MRGTLTLSDGEYIKVTASASTEAGVRTRYAEKMAAAKAKQLATGPQATLRERCEHWLKIKTREVATRTHVEYRRLLEQHVYSTLGEMQLSAIRPKDITAVLNGIRAKGHPATADYVRRVLKQMFSHAVQDEVITVSPAAEIRGKRRAHRASLDEHGSAPEELRIWTPREVTLFLEALTGRPYREMLIVAIFTGLRSGELICLRRDDIHRDGRELLVRRAYDPHAPGRVGPPKTRQSVRGVPLSQIARDAVNTAIARSDERTASARGNTDEGWLFPNARGKLYDQRNYHRQFTKALRIANTAADGSLLVGDKARVRRIRLHDLRHIYASYLARQGHGPAIIQRLLGHATPDLALRVYQHVNRDDLFSAALELEHVIQ